MSAAVSRADGIGAFEASLDGIARTLAAATAVGLVLGALIGGVGGRLAMRLLFLTSGPGVRGVISDDGFLIGRFSPAATLNLIVVGALFGVIGAFGYLAVRPFLLGPRWLRYLGVAIGGGAVVGAMIVHPDGVDFRLLSPRWLAIALFVALPALFAVAAASGIDRATRPDSWFWRAKPQWALAPLLIFLFPPLLVLLGVPTLIVIGVLALAHRWPVMARLVRQPAAVWVVRGGWVAAGCLGAVSLVRDAAEIL